MADEFNGARSRLHHAALQRRRVLRSGVQHARRVRVLHAAVRHARPCRAPSAARSTTRCSSRVRKRFSDGYQFDVNYTLGYAKDHASLLEGDYDVRELQHGGYTGFLIDSWDPDQELRQRGLRRPAPGEHELDRGPAVRPAAGNSAATCTARSTPSSAAGPRRACSA